MTEPFDVKIPRQADPIQMGLGLGRRAWLTNARGPATRNGRRAKLPAATFFFCLTLTLRSIHWAGSVSLALIQSTLPVALFLLLLRLCHPLHPMSHGDKVVLDNNVPESQFQKPGDLVERDYDTGVMQMESLCMNCHENVCH